MVYYVLSKNEASPVRIASTEEVIKMPTKALTPEQILCFQSAVELTSAAVINGAGAVKDYMLTIYPSLVQVLQRVKTL